MQSARITAIPQAASSPPTPTSQILSSNLNLNNPTSLINSASTLTTPPTPTFAAITTPSPTKPPPPETTLPEPTILLLATLIPTLILLLCAITAYTLSIQRRKNATREIQAARRYPDTLAERNNFNAEEVWDDESVVTGGRRYDEGRERERETRRKTTSSVGFSSVEGASSVGFSRTASVTDSTTEEPTNLSSYSSFVYGN